MRKNTKSFRGGYIFRNFKGQPAETLDACKIPEKVIIPLKQGMGFPCEPLVKVGDNVRAGQVIGRNDEHFCNPVHASVNGTVTNIKPVGSPGNEIAAIYLDTDTEESADIMQIDGYSAEWQKLDAEHLEKLVYLSGAAALDSCGIPTGFRSAALKPADIEHIVIKGIEDDLFHPATEVLLGDERIGKFADGCRILKKIMPAADMHVALSESSGNLPGQLEKELSGEKGISFQLVSRKYPQSKDEVLIPSVLGIPFPYGYAPINAGIIVLGIQTVIHVFDAVVHGMPVIERIIALGGPGFTEPKHLKVRIGTPVEAIVSGRIDSEREQRLVCDSPITGKTVTDMNLPATRACEALYAIPEARSVELLSFARPGINKDSYSNTFLSRILPFKKSTDTNVRGEKRACLSCSFCADVCPVGILPNLLHKYVDRELITETLQELKIFNCIDCNLCTYVCPSKIGVAQLIKKGKEMLRAEGISDEEKIMSSFTLKGLE